MLKKTFMKRCLKVFSVGLASNPENSHPSNAKKHSIVVKRLGPGEVVVIKDRRVSKVYSMQGLRRLI